ncbi:MAG: prolyl oligopeptidase family protein [Phycisphaerales bacterium]
MVIHGIRSLSLLVLVASAAAAVPAGPPTTPARPVTDTVHGVPITDDYRWLEGDNSDPRQMGRVTPEVASWTDQQNEYTRSVLDNLPGRKELEAKLRPLMEVGGVSAPRMIGNRYFYSKREGSENQARYFMREGHDGKPKLLLDPAVIDPSGLTTIAWTSPSWDGKVLAYGTYRAGDEIAVARFMDIDTGADLPGTIGSKVGAVSWLPDGSGFVYRNLADVRSAYTGQVRFMKLDGWTGYAASDTLLLRQLTPSEDKKLATTYGPYGGLSKDGRWLVLSYATGTRNNDLWVADFDAYRASGKLTRIDIVVGQPCASGGDIVGDTMFLQTTLDAPNGQVFEVDLRKPARSNWQPIIPERSDAVMTGVSVAKGILAVTYLKNATTQIELFDFTGKPLGQLKLPGIGSAGLSTEQDRTEAFLTFTSYNYPTTIFRVDLAKPSAEPALWERPDVPVDPSTVEVRQEWFTSKDGTKVPMFIVHKKGLKLDGNNPTLLYGYGGFMQSMTPSFSATNFQWFDAGGVYAVANIRGGGEFGEKWHEAGMFERKQNCFDDFIAAGEYLVKQKYTNPKRLACMGGSNGGLLTGAMVTQRPDLFAAAIVAVPLLDMVRFQDFLMAKYWVTEYGNAAASKQEFDYIFKYSPYHNIRKGTKYPAVMLTAGENDSRVHPLHARKMAAALRAATSSDQEKHPILLWVDREAGHGQGKPLNLRIRDTADQRIFLMWQLGMLDGLPAGMTRPTSSAGTDMSK